MKKKTTNHQLNARYGQGTAVVGLVLIIVLYLVHPGGMLAYFGVIAAALALYSGAYLACSAEMAMEREEKVK